MARKPGGNPEALKKACEQARAVLDGEIRLPRPRVAFAPESAKCQGVLAAVEKNGLLIGGAAFAADGFRRILRDRKDGEKCHKLRNTLQTGAGIGMFAAGVALRRAAGTHAEQER